MFVKTNFAPMPPYLRAKIDALPSLAERDVAQVLFDRTGLDACDIVATAKAEGYKEVYGQAFKQGRQLAVKAFKARVSPESLLKHMTKDPPPVLSHESALQAMAKKAGITQKQLAEFGPKEL